MRLPFIQQVAPKLREHPELFALFSNNITLTSLNSNNEVVNIIPDKIRVLLDCRLLPGQSEQTFLQKVKNRLKNNEIEITVLHEGPKMVPSSKDNQFHRLFKEAIKARFPEKEIISIFMPSTNDTGHFRAKGIPAYTSIPILIGREHLSAIHNYNERLPIAALQQGQAVYTEFLARCLQQEGATRRPLLAEK